MTTISDPKDQKGSVSTRFGNRKQSQRCVAILRANGLDVYLDMVEHQRVGDTLSRADATPNVGRRDGLVELIDLAGPWSCSHLADVGSIQFGGLPD
jgi:hypothetical protein